MTKLSTALLAAFGIVALCSGASAQVPSYNWTGFYLGANLGYSWGESSSTLFFSDANRVLSSTGTNFNMNGAVGGGQIGYNWQNGIWLLGFEADIQGTGQKGNGSALCAGGASSPISALNGVCTPGHVGDTRPFDVAAFPVYSTLSQELNWFGTIRARAGYLITPTIVVFGTGGFAFGNVDSTMTVTGTNITGTNGTNVFALSPVFASFSDSSTKTGWTLGAGIEGVLFGNWTGKIEYLYVDLGTVSGAFVTPLVTNSGGLLVTGYNSRITDNILRAGLNFKFGP